MYRIYPFTAAPFPIIVCVKNTFSMPLCQNLFTSKLWSCGLCARALDGPLISVRNRPVSESAVTKPNPNPTAILFSMSEPDPSSEQLM